MMFLSREQNYFINKGSDSMKCSKCGCLVDEYYHSYKYDDLDYCHHCMLQVLVDVDIIEITSYNDEYKRFLESLESIK